MLAKYPDLVGDVGKNPTGETVTMKDMHDLLQSTRDISASQYPQERMIASKVKDALDNHIEQNFPSGKQFTGSKLRYAIASTALDLKNLVQRAKLRESQSTHQTMDKTLATEFRNFVRNDRKMRMLNGVSPEAATKLRSFVSEEGDSGSMRKILRGLGSASPNSVLSFSLDNIAGHLLHSIIPGGPYTIMAVGAGAKYLGGKMASQSIEDIMDTVLASDDINKLEGLVSEPVSTKLASQPATKQAVVNWAKASGKAKTVAAHGLAIAIARQLNTPKLVPRIEPEINGLDNQNVTDVKEQLPYAGTLIGLGLSQRVDINGRPLVGWLLYVYDAFTTVPANTFCRLVPVRSSAVPITADAFGMLPMFWVADGTYRAVATDALGSQTLFDSDGILAIGPSTGTGGGGGSGVDANSVFQTGDPLWRPTTGVRAGFVRMNALTIGSVGSGATERANADTQTLYLYYWNNFPTRFVPLREQEGQML